MLKIKILFNLIKLCVIFQIAVVLLKISEISGTAIHQNIQISLQKWLDGIRKVQTSRKDEIINANSRQRIGQPRLNDDKGLFKVVFLNIKLKFKYNFRCCRFGKCY
jgi:hypothetical protein